MLKEICILGRISTSAANLHRYADCAPASYVHPSACLRKSSRRSPRMLVRRACIFLVSIRRFHLHYTVHLFPLFLPRLSSTA